MFVSTGFSELDRLLWGGLRRPGLTVLAANDVNNSARALALNIAHNAAAELRAKVVVSLKMSKEEVSTRLLSIETGVDAHRLNLRLYTEAEGRRIIDGTSRLLSFSIHIIDDGQMPSKPLVGNVDLIIVDSLLVGVGGKRLLARPLRKMAQDLNASVVVVSQLKRVVKICPDYRPTLSDLAKGLRVAADAVVFVHRDDVYNTQEEWLRRHPDEAYPQNIATIIVARRRPFGECSFYVLGERFLPLKNENLEQEEEDGDPF